ncbi:DUF4097 family beta strand repeat-containing protein [Sphaerisporangium fuscum]|uniref:DUF4097 family beta strand repeat-containing protein n=1 Tax=Sphaerisporangium fuscum TaxID=2835868 RepID=UPI001BDCFA0A|nr:DUF4097 family beta strand repeat-containing protein [Sphaerisporangium fuscum]
MRLRHVIAAGTALGAGLLLTGCDLKSIGGPTEQATQSYDVAGKVATLRVDSGSGEIVVNESGRTGIHVTETLHWRSSKPTTRHPVEGDALRLDSTCSHGDFACSVDYTVEIPHGLQVRVDTGSGAITLRALSGEVKASTGSGDIDANGLGGKQVTARTGSGDVDLRFAAVPDNVTVDSGSGAGVVRVPQNTYNVTAWTGSGEKRVDVDNDAGSPRRISVKTGSGDAKVLKA